MGDEASKTNPTLSDMVAELCQSPGQQCLYSCVFAGKESNEPELDMLVEVRLIRTQAKDQTHYHNVPAGDYPQIDLKAGAA